MFGFVRLWVGIFVRLFGCRRCLLIENLALRQQLAVFKRQNSRPRLAAADKLFWVLLRRFWSPWKNALMVVSPPTVVRWHRSGFRMYWQLISRVRKPVGRRPVTKEIRDLIFKMATENPSWRAPRIHGELVMRGFEVSERSVSRWMGRAPQTPESGQRWLTFLSNHREAIAAKADSGKANVLRRRREGRRVAACRWSSSSLRTTLRDSALSCFGLSDLEQLRAHYDGSLPCWPRAT